MGGNYIFNGIKSNPISLLEHSRNSIVEEIKGFLKFLNMYSENFNGHPLWCNDILCYRNIYSGSTRFLFDVTISEEELKLYKPTFGDLDIMIPDERKYDLLDLLINFESSEYTLIGFKRSVDQIITLFKLPTLGIVQIDFECLEFDQNGPTEWSRFSHYSSFKDTRAGIKGVFHKFLLRALTAKTLSEKIILPQSKLDICTEKAFSLKYGLRDSLKHEYGIVYSIQSTSNSVYTTDLNEIFKYFFEKDIYLQQKFWSFVGIIDLCNEYASQDYKENILIGFAHSILSKNAQQLIRDNPSEDLKIKMTALEYIFKQWPEMIYMKRFL